MRFSFFLFLLVATLCHSNIEEDDDEMMDEFICDSDDCTTTECESLTPDTTPVFDASTVIDDTTVTTLMYSGEWDYSSDTESPATGDVVAVDRNFLTSDKFAFPKTDPPSIEESKKNHAHQEL
ncbi:unnamed protein product [Caenorhabditis sp. 36 PRJEB53466]|nr:unnamed protein product [Caenorhabditis sp. 36 PRJEB53466]